MASKYILLVHKGELKQCEFSAPQSPRRHLSAWLNKTYDVARTHNARHYAFRFKDHWQIVETTTRAIVHRFHRNHEDAAGMYLLHALPR